MNKNSVLFIDTSSNEHISVGVQLGDKKEVLDRKIDTRKAQAVLPMIDEILQKHNLSIADIGSIEVNEGPGSYTGLRVGVAIANALAFSLNIPVNGKPISEFVEPKYE